MPLVINIKVSLPPKGSPRHQTIERPVLVDEDNNIQEIEDEGIRALKKRRQEAPPVNIGLLREH